MILAFFSDMDDNESCRSSGNSDRPRSVYPTIMMMRLDERRTRGRRNAKKQNMGISQEKHNCLRYDFAPKPGVNQT